MPLIALLGRLDMVEKESELYRFSIATAKTEKQRKKKKHNRIHKNYGTTIKGVIHKYQEYQRERKKSIILNNDLKCFQIYVRYQSLDPESSETPCRMYAPKNHT